MFWISHIDFWDQNTKIHSILTHLIKVNPGQMSIGEVKIFELNGM